MNRASALCPGRLTATLQPFRLLRPRNVSIACGINCPGLASGWERILGCWTRSKASATTRPVPGSGRSLIALRAACPISMPHTGWSSAMRICFRIGSGTSWGVRRTPRTRQRDELGDGVAALGRRGGRESSRRPERRPSSVAAGAGSIGRLTGRPGPPPPPPPPRLHPRRPRDPRPRRPVPVGREAARRGSVGGSPATLRCPDSPGPSPRRTVRRVDEGAPPCPPPLRSRPSVLRPFRAALLSARKSIAARLTARLFKRIGPAPARRERARRAARRVRGD